ncbi:MAG: 50S ribosomal protein L4 [Verrucomicrobia bacterium]|nr:MAG: 50S ribosomal protein L4 [Verrucomicrobiota bacterium]
MSATILTAEAAKKANIDIITDGKGTQAVHDVVVAMRANRRSGTASVKTKATVNLSGKKPWKQKGTGRARAGYASSPVWVGGGVVHGPHPRSYAKRTPKAVKRLAFRKALSARILSGDVLVVESFGVTEGKTKAFLTLVNGIAGDVRKTLIVAVSFDKLTNQAANNVHHTRRLMTAAEVNTENFLAFDKIIITKDALEALGQRITA